MIIYQQYADRHKLLGSLRQSRGTRWLTISRLALSFFYSCLAPCNRVRFYQEDSQLLSRSLRPYHRTSPARIQGILYFRRAVPRGIFTGRLHSSLENRFPRATARPLPRQSSPRLFLRRLHGSPPFGLPRPTVWIGEW